MMADRVLWEGRDGVTLAGAVDEILSELDRVYFHADRRAIETDLIATQGDDLDVDALDAHVIAASTWQVQTARALVLAKLQHALASGHALSDLVIVR